MRLRSLFALLPLVALPACDRAIAFEGLDGAPGPKGEAGPSGAPGPEGPRGESAARAGARVRPLWLTSDDGAAAWLGSWWDSERAESCSFVPAEEGQLRCLPPHRTQQAFPAWAASTCEGARASQVHEPGYIRESASEAFYQLGAPISEAWGLGADGSCGPLGEGPWYAWESVEWSSFVAGDVAPD